MTASRKYYLIILLLALMSGCATYKAQYRDDYLKVEVPDKNISHSFYFIGDAGASPENSKSIALQAFEKELGQAKENSTAIFLGDNVYQRGIPPKSHDDYEKAIYQIEVQTDVVKDFKGRPIFMPGNHDWYNGLAGLKRQEKYVEDKLGKDSFLPESGCPIERINISEDIVLIIVDPEWYITKWDKHPNINDNCEIRMRQSFWEEYEGEIKKARGKTTIVALHHPMYSNGPHGGQFSFVSHLVPLPGLGTIKNMLLKMGGVSPADLSHNRYDEFKRRIVALSQENEKVIFVSGHEHSLQYIVQDNLPQIISGSGSKTTATRNAFGGQFSYGTQGYARLDVYDDGSSFVRFYSAEDDKLVYQTEVLEEDEIKVPDIQKNWPDEVTTSIYPKEDTEKGSFYKWLWGKRYRELYGRDITVPTVDLDTIHGGLTPIRKGGGHQSVSLRMENPQGQQYMMRAIRKDGAQYLQAEGFRDQYVKQEIRDTGTEKLVLDVFTGGHPYAAFIVGDLADAVGVFHTNPKLFYVPKQNALGKYIDDFGNTLYMIEERTTDDHGDKASFGYSNKMISTFEMLDKLHKDEENKVDEVAYVRARLFDMLIGDWDRHDDQWRWAKFEEDGFNIYRPVPRDRDQPFSIMSDGFLFGAGTSLIQPLRLLKSYDEDIKDLRFNNRSVYPLDVALMQRADKEIWDEQAAFIQANITDELIDDAFDKMPNAFKDQSMEEIKRKLRGRRSNLKKISDAYFEVANKYAMVKGTDKDDWFDIVRMPDGKTRVTAYRIKGGEKADVMHDRVYDRKYTKEIWLYALDDDDYIHVTGEGDKMIKLRIVGGSNNDTYHVENGTKAHIYDFKNKPNKFITNKGNKHLSKNYNNNNYTYEKPKHSSNSIIPIIAGNPDDGLLLGINDTYTVMGFDQNPFTSKHQFGAAFYLATSGFRFGYRGEFAHVVGKWNLEAIGTFTSPNFAINFFGYGNSTPNPNAEDDDLFEKDYNRVKIGSLGGYLGLVWRGVNNGRFHIGGRLERVEVEITEGRFIEEYDNIFGQREESTFVSGEAKYEYSNLDVPAFPTLGMEVAVETGVAINTKNANTLVYMVPELTFHHKLTSNGRLVLNTTSKAHINFGDQFEFYQAASIGGNDGLRGYRNQRFTGKSSFYQSSNVLWNFRRYRTNVLPMELGIFGGFDVGRIWVDDSLLIDPSFNGESWNTSVGGGLFMNATDLFAVNLGIFHSDDTNRFFVGFKFGF